MIKVCGIQLFVAAALAATTGCATEGPMGPAGPEGGVGAPGADGDDGLNGIDGVDGEDGTDGADGADGADGENGIGFDSAYSGTVNDSTGGAAFVPVAFDVLGPNGAVFATLGATMTDATGAFTIHVADLSGPNSQIRIRAFTGEGTLWAYASSDSALIVDAASTAVGTAISWIVGTEGDDSVLSDYTPAELAALTQSARDALVAAGTDLSDASAVWMEVLMSTGGDISGGSSGSFVALASIPMVPPAATNVVAAWTSYDFDWNDVAADEDWDLYTNGNVSDGSDDAFDGAAYLDVDGDYFPNTYDLSWPTNTEDGSELVLGPVPDLSANGVDVTQKIQILEGLGAARWMIILDNTTASDVTTSLNVYHGLGTDEDTDLAIMTSSGDLIVGSDDSWLVAEGDNFETAVGILAPGWLLSKDEDSVDMDITVTVPAAGSITVWYWLIQEGDVGSVNNGPIVATLQGFGEFPSDPAWYLGATQDEVNSSVVFFGPPNVSGSAGTAAPNEVVTLTNTASLETLAVTASPDGSFSADFDVDSGEQVDFVGSYGSTGTSVAP